LERLVTASIEARADLVNTTPTTAAGLLALLRFVLEQSEADGIFTFDSEAEITCFVASVEQAVAAMIGA
jgi:hypothetical protein